MRHDKLWFISLLLFFNAAEIEIKLLIYSFIYMQNKEEPTMTSSADSSSEAEVKQQVQDYRILE